MGTTSSTTVQNLGEIVQRAPAVGAKIWCLYVCFLSCSEAGALFIRGDILWAGLCRCLWVDFDSVFSIFQEGIALSDGINSSHFTARWRHNFREISVKNCEKFKNRQKILCAPLRIDILDFRTNPPHCFGARNVDVHLYKIFFHTLLHSTSSNCQISHRESKMARNKQVCVHQKSVNFPKYFWQFCTGWTVFVHLYCGFSIWRQMAPQQSAKFRTAFLVSFFTSLRKDSVSNYASI